MSADHTGEDMFWAPCEFRWSTGNRKLRTLTGADTRTLRAARLPAIRNWLYEDRKTRGNILRIRKQSKQDVNDKFAHDFTKRTQ